MKGEYKEKYHPFQLKLFVIACIAQDILQELVKCFTSKNNSVDPDATLEEMLQQQGLKGSENPIEITKIDTSRLCFFLHKLEGFPTSFNNRFRCTGSMHKFKCCNSCNHECFECKKSNSKDECCISNDRLCTNKICKETKVNCINNDHVCCEKCQLCKRCFMNTKKIKHMDNFLEYLINVDKTFKCHTQALKSALFLLKSFRNAVMHMVPEKCIEMENKTYDAMENKLPSFCTSWEKFHQVYCFAIKSVVHYLILDDHYEKDEMRKITEELDFIIKDDLLDQHEKKIDRFFAIDAIQETILEVKEISKNLQDVRMRLTAPILESLVIKIRFSKTAEGSVFQDDLDSKELKDIKIAFRKAVEECFKEEYRFYKIVIPGFVEGRSNDPKNVFLQFEITPNEEKYILTDFESSESLKSEDLWKKLTDIISKEFDNKIKISKRWWKLGSITIHALIRKISGKEWTDEDRKNIQKKLPEICKQFEEVYCNFNCACLRMESVNEKQNGEIVIFEIHPLLASCKHISKMIDLDYLLLRFQFWFEGEGAITDPGKKQYSTTVEINDTGISIDEVEMIIRPFWNQIAYRSGVKKAITDEIEIDDNTGFKSYKLYYLTKEHKEQLKSKVKTDLPKPIASSTSLTSDFDVARKLRSIGNGTGSDEENWKKHDLVFGVAGSSGSGKSSFINSLRGLNIQDKGSAKVGCVETPKVPTPYADPKNSKLVYWDLPGVGTSKFPKDSTYLERVEYEKYDCFLIIACNPFTEDDLWLAKQIRAKGKKFYFVRTKLDIDLQARKRNYPNTFIEDHAMKKIRCDVQIRLSELGLNDTAIFLVSNHFPGKYDFPYLCLELIKSLPAHKKVAMTLSILSFSEEIIAEKKKVLKTRILTTVTASDVSKLSPAPSLSLVVDTDVITKELLFCMEQFGLEEDNIKRYQLNSETATYLASLATKGFLLKLFQPLFGISAVGLVGMFFNIEYVNLYRALSCELDKLEAIAIKVVEQKFNVEIE